MESTDVSRHGMWSNPVLFVLAAAGSAVGLGNIWKFPYIAGENGGAAFVVVYLFCIALIGIPIMMAEIMIGRHGRQSPVNTMRMLVRESGGHRSWTVIGWAGALAGFLILSYYGVIAGWAVYYVFQVGSGAFTGADGDFAGAVFTDLLASPWTMLLWQTLFMLVTVIIVARGVSRGLEVIVRWFMPLLFVLIGVLVTYAAILGDFGRGLSFLFGFDASALTVDGFLIALGHAFFTLSLGMGAIMAYGAYVPAGVSITKAAVTIALLDTLVALATGLAIFPIVFASPGLEPGEGPGLLFVTIPIALGNMPFGAIFGTLFFLLVSFAAITSAISLTEPAIAYMVEEYNASRTRVAISIGVACWFIGIGSVLSFNAWDDVLLFGKTFFDLLDYLTSNIMLPIGGLLIALFVGYVMPKHIAQGQIGMSDAFAVVWDILIKIVAPIGVLVVFLYTIFGQLFD